MVQVIRFCEDPLVEGKPGELAIDETCLGVEVDRPDLDRLRAGAHYCSPVGAITGRPRVNTTPLVGVCHVIGLRIWVEGTPSHHTWRDNGIRATVPSVAKARMGVARRGGRS